jgi:hypothetical protein
MRSGEERSRGEEAAVWAEKKKEWPLRSCLPVPKTGKTRWTAEFLMLARSALAGKTDSSW